MNLRSVTELIANKIKVVFILLKYVLIYFKTDLQIMCPDSQADDGLFSIYGDRRSENSTNDTFYSSFMNLLLTESEKTIPLIQ